METLIISPALMETLIISLALMETLIISPALMVVMASVTEEIKKRRSELTTGHVEPN
jgi:hypothetical protein